MASYPARPPAAEREVLFHGIDLLRPAAALGIVAIHLATALEVHRDSPIWTWLRLRDFALPFFLLVSVFLLTRSLLGGSARPPAPLRSLRNRFRVLGLPFLFWHLAHILLIGGVCGVVLGIPVDPVSWTEYLTGVGHLWFLQFVLLASCLVILTLSLLPRSGRHLDLWGGLALLLGVGLLFSLKLYRPADQRLGYVLTFVHLIPLGVALAFFHAAHRGWLTWGRLGPWALLGLTAIALAYTLSSRPALWQRTLFGCAMVVVALLPWPGRWAGRVRLLADHSYGIYILHVLVILVFREACRVLGVAHLLAGSSLLLLGGSLTCLLLSFLASLVLSDLLARVGWQALLPVGRPSPRQGRSGREEVRPRQSAPRPAPVLSCLPKTCATEPPLAPAESEPAAVMAGAPSCSA